MRIRKTTEMPLCDLCASVVHSFGTTEAQRAPRRTKRRIRRYAQINADEEMTTKRTLPDEL
jgi:hypothetical protein